MLGVDREFVWQWDIDICNNAKGIRWDRNYKLLEFRWDHIMHCCVWDGLSHPGICVRSSESLTPSDVGSAAEEPCPGAPLDANQEL